MKFIYTILFILLNFTFIKAQSVCNEANNQFFSDNFLLVTGDEQMDSLFIRNGAFNSTFLNNENSYPLLSVFDTTIVDYYNLPSIFYSRNNHIFRNYCNLDTFVSDFHQPMNLPCFNNYNLDVFASEDSSDYLGTSLLSYRINNTSHFYEIDSNNDTIYGLYSIDSVNVYNIKEPNVLALSSYCGYSLYPECNNYKLSFYIRPYKYVSYLYKINADTLFENAFSQTQCLYSYQDYIFMDSLQLNFYEKFYANKFDSVIIENDFIKLSDTTQWSKVEHIFSPSDTTNLLSLTPYFNFDAYFLTDSNGMRYKAIVDSINALPNISDNIYQGQISLYYLFDSFSLVPIGYENLDLCLPDTSFCESFSINVDAYQPEFTRYEWSTGDTTSSINIDSAGTYTLSAYYPCGVLCDEFTVFEEPANYLLPLSYADTLIICEQDLPITLNAADTFTTYLWSNGDTTFSSSFNQEGMVYLETEHFCGTLIDSVYLNVIETESLNINDTTLCANQNIITINANPNFDTYLWSNGDTTASSSFDTAGIYWVQAFYLCDTLTDTFQVFEEPTLILNYADTLEFCATDLPIILQAADTFQNYLWSNNVTTFSSSFNQEGMVYLETQHFCGTLIDSVYLNVIETESLNINDTTICANQNIITINANPNFDTYLWSNGDTTASSSFDTSGIYWVQAFYLCDTLTDTFQVFEEPTLILNYADTLEFCATDLPIILQAADTFQNYSWSNGDTTFSSSFNQEGMVYLETQHFCGTLRDSVYLNVIETESLNINDTTICANQNIITINANPNFDTYLWSNGDTIASSSFDTTGIYWVQAFYLCDTLTDTFEVFEEPTLILNYADTLEFCASDLPITLQAADTFQNYSWSNGATTFSTSFNQEGMVYLEIQHFCGTLHDSVYLKLKDKENLDLIPFTDTLICASDLPFAIQINDTLQNYLWSNGATTFQNTFDAAGTYFVNADNGCHYYTDTFTLQTENLEAGNFKHQNIYCPEDFPITLTAPSTLNPNWNTGENTNSITVNNAVNEIYVHNSYSAVCGNRTDSFFVYVLPDTISQLPQILIDDFCLEEGFYQFSTIVNDTNFVYQWENQTSLNFTTKGGTTQTLSISNACLSLQIDTFIERCPEQIAFALPTVFSPNNDGVNDIFQLLYLNPNYQFNNLKIYNRWGELIFNSINETIGWDGIYKNKNAPIGNYIYHLELLNDMQATETFKGNLSLIR